VWFQNITASVVGSGGSFGTNGGSEASLKGACKAAGSFFCSKGATVSVSWFLNGTSAPLTMTGTLVRPAPPFSVIISIVYLTSFGTLQSLCFPNACCEDQTCEDDNTLDSWVSNELVGTMNHLCQSTSSQFCYDVRSSWIGRSLLWW
jgi:hypothetical protein